MSIALEESISESSKIEKVDHLDYEDQAEAEDELKFKAMEIVSNELICKILGCYLNTSDLKCCRLVNRKFNRMVMDGTDFRNRVVLKVKKEHLKASEFGKTKENWKKISLKFPAFRACNPSNYEWLFPLLKEVKYLRLRLQKEKKFGCKIDIHPLFGLLLSACKKLKSLAVEPHFIRLGSGIFQGLETLEKLEQLEILQPNYMWGHFWGPWFDMTLMNEYRLAEEFGELLENLKIYKSYFTEKKTIYAPEDLDRLLENNMELPFLHHLVEQVIINNQQCLESHPFYDIHQWASDQELMLEPDPHHDQNYHDTLALKCLQADATQLNARMTHAFYNNWPFVEYLNSRPPLEQLEIAYPTYNRTTYFLRRHVENAIDDKHAGTLKTFKLQAGDVFRDFDWSLMTRQPNLTDVRLEDMRELGKIEQGESNDWIVEVIMNLPKTVRRIYLKGAEGLKGNNKLKTRDFFRFDPNVVEQLTMFNTGGSLGNDVAGYICKNFRMLRRLNLSDTKTDDTGFSGISKLKGLQFLTLKGCRISNKTLKEIAFRELRYLDVSGNAKVTLGGIQTAMRQCPSLETLIIPKLKSKLTREDGQKICPRLKHLMEQ